jgi:hypothetical protein
MNNKKSCLVTAGISFLGGVLLLILLFTAIRTLSMAKRNISRPTIQILLPKLDEPVNVKIPTNVQVSATAHGSPVKIVEFYADGFLAGERKGPEQTLAGTWRWTPQAEGPHLLTFLAYDQDGDVNVASLQVAAIASSDRDSDGIPDSQDGCPDQAGPAASKGCLLADDRDRDGIPDGKDLCPDETGSAEYSGCTAGTIPDRDRDGMPDLRDRCPDLPGLPEWEGCPAAAWVVDRDGDGVPDFLDPCPDRAGRTESGGCLSITAQDTDGDGVTDDVDACVDQPGPAENHGCPVRTDRDGDGVPDDVDSCPDTAGLEAFHGCLPAGWDTDTDGDGVLDYLDRCDTIPGPPENLGCPLPDDSDGDGITDTSDDCPDLAGLPEDGGCPITPLPDLGLLLRSTLFPEMHSLLEICSRDPSPCDRDGDGLTGRDDECPDDPGTRDRHGCPAAPMDQDGDGVLDRYDRCPTQPGDPANLGCPDSNDLDNDGIPFALDACPEQAGPPDNHGCPRPGRAVNVEVEILALNTAAGWSGIYCYLQPTGFTRMLRVPETGYLDGFTDTSWDIHGDRAHTTIALTEDGALTVDAMCWAMPGPPTIMPAYLGRLIRTHGYADWDNQIRQARTVGSGGWLEISYHMCRNSCP